MIVLVEVEVCVFVAVPSALSVAEARTGRRMRMRTDQRLVVERIGIGSFSGRYAMCVKFCFSIFDVRFRSFFFPFSLFRPRSLVGGGGLAGL